MSNEESEALMNKSMALLNQVFTSSGGSYSERDEKMVWVDKHTAKSLSLHENAVRVRLNEFVDALA